MKSFKLHNYTTLEQAINTVAQELNNTVTVSKKLAVHLNGQPINSISRTATHLALQSEAAKNLPNYLDYLKAGINLASTMPNCEVSDQALATIEHTIKEFTPSHLKDGLRYVAYSQKTGTFAVTEEGKAALDAAVTRLDSADEKTYELMTALHTHLKASYGPNSVRKFVSGQFLDTFTNELRDEALVPQIKSVANPR